MPPKLLYTSREEPADTLFPFQALITLDIKPQCDFQLSGGFQWFVALYNQNMPNWNITEDSMQNGSILRKWVSDISLASLVRFGWNFACANICTFLSLWQIFEVLTGFFLTRCVKKSLVELQKFVTSRGTCRYWLMLNFNPIGQRIPEIFADPLV